MISETQILELSESFAQIGQGCLRIRNVLKGVLATGREEAEEKTDSILVEAFHKTVASNISGLILTRHLGVWNEVSPIHFFRYCIRGRLRCNRNKMFWYHKGGTLESKENWKKLSQDKVSDIFFNVTYAWNLIRDHIEALESRPEGLSKFRWERRKVLLETEMPSCLLEKRSPYRDILVAIHEDLPKLR